MIERSEVSVEQRLAVLEHAMVALQSAALDQANTIKSLLEWQVAARNAFGTKLLILQNEAGECVGALRMAEGGVPELRLMGPGGLFVARPPGVDAAQSGGAPQKT